MMLSTLRRYGAIAATIALAAATFPAQLAAQSVTLLHVNDTHSHLDGWGPKDASLNGTLGGLPKVATIVKAEKALDPQALFVHAGDFMNGDLFFNEYLGVPELKMLQSLGLTAFALGNHEFAFGPDFLAAVLNATWPGGSGGVPIVGTNITCSKIGAWNVGTLMKDANGVKVGIFGLTTQSKLLRGPDPCVIESLKDAAQTAVAALQAGGAQVIVAISHAGMDQARMLAIAVPGIDVIVNGHDNALLEQPEAVARPGSGFTWIVSAGAHYGWVGRLRLSWTGSSVNFVDYALTPIDANIMPDPATQATIESLKTGIVARYGDVYHDPLAWAEDDVAAEWDVRHAKRDTPLGNLFADAYREWTGTDIAIEAMGFLRDPLPRGWIVGADVFRAMSFGLPATVGGKMIVRPFRLLTFRATGDSLVFALETTIGKGGDYFPQVSGIRLSYAGSQILRDTVHVGGQKLVGNKLYSVTVTEAVYSALKSFGVAMRDVTPPGNMAFDAARDLVEERGEIGGSGSNRLRDVAAIGNNDKD